MDIKNALFLIYHSLDLTAKDFTLLLNPLKCGSVNDTTEQICS